MPTSPVPGIAGVFDRAAATYDAVGVPFFTPIAEGLVAELAPRAGERALDVGCGRGAVLAALARAVGPDGRAVGIDLAPGMVRRTAEDLAPLPWVEVRLGDGQAPSFPPGSFDLVASSLVVFFLDDPLAALRRWTELLAPAGRLGVTTFGPEDPRWREIDDVFLPYLPRAADDEGPTTDPFDTDAGTEALLADAGLVDVRTVRLTIQARFRDVDHLVAFSRSHGQRRMWEAVPPAARADVRARIGERVAELGLGPDGFTLSQVVRHTLARRAVPLGG